jgi:hypothetical protein
MANDEESGMSFGEGASGSSEKSLLTQRGVGRSDNNKGDQTPYINLA